MEENNKILKGIPSPAEFPIRTSVNSLVRLSNPDSKFKFKFKAPTLDKAIWKSWKFSRLRKNRTLCSLGFK